MFQASARQLVSEIPVLARNCMAERGLRIAMTPRPVRSATLQRPQLLRLQLCQAGEQKVPEQCVVAVRNSPGPAWPEIRKFAASRSVDDPRCVRVAAQLDGQFSREPLGGWPYGA